MFELLRNMRVDVTEFCLQTFSEFEKPYVDKVSALRGNVNVYAVSPLSTIFEPQLFSPCLRVRADAEMIFKKVCYACCALGAKFYTFRGQVNLTGTRNFDYQRLAQRYNQLSDIAATYGVTLSLRNMRWSFAATPEFFSKLLALCPRLYASIDMYNAELAGYDIREFFDACPPNRVSLVGVADSVKDEWRLPGRGRVNFDKLLYDLDRRRMTAPVLIATPSDCYSDFVQVRDSFEYLTGVYAKAR